MGCEASTIPNSLSNNTHPTVTPLSLSSTLNQQTDSNQVPKWGRQIDTNQIIENFLLIWLDEKIDESNEDYQNSIKHLRHTVNTVETFQKNEECIDYTSRLQDKKAFLIISDALCQTVVPRIHNIDQVHSIYVFCRKKEKCQEWTKEWSKIKGIYTEVIPICDLVRQSVRQCDEDSVLITEISSLNQNEPSFIYTQLFKEIILEIDFDEKKEINDLVDYARKKYVGNDEQLKIIDEFAENYRSHLDENNKPIWWYTRDCFTYRMLNKALNDLHVETLLKMGIFMRDLHKNIDKLHSEQTNGIHSVYRGKTMTNQDFNNKIKQGGLISFNNFLSTSIVQNVAIEFISKGLESNKNKIGVLFKITIDQSVSSAAFARIDKISYYHNKNEILFSLHTIFRVQQIKEIREHGMTIWQVKLTLITENDDEQLKALRKRMREEITGTEWQLMGSLLWKLREDDKAEQLYTMLLEQASNENNKAYCYGQLGMIKDNQGEYKQALEFYEKLLDIKKKTLSPNAIDLAATYNNIGVVYKNMKDYSKALASYERSLEIRAKALPPNHSDLAQSYLNIGSVYYNMGEYSKALSSYERSLEIRKIALPPNHPHLASSFTGIGVVYSHMGEYSKALLLYEQSLKIREIALPPNHPDLAASYNNIGNVYYNMGEYSKPLSYYDKAQEIWKKSLPPTHPYIALVQRNIEIVKQKL